MGRAVSILIYWFIFGHINANDVTNSIVTDVDKYEATFYHKDHI